jgi:hypothetical protein
MRKKPSMNNGYPPRHKPRYQGAGGGHSSGGHQHNNHNRPRRNYGAAREKYLAQARDAMASGDRVLAENYLQHAEHCYRMMVEEGSHRPQQPRPQQTEGGEATTNIEGETDGNSGGHQEFIPNNTGALPAFITGYEQQQKPAEQPPVQNWEERDA